VVVLRDRLKPRREGVEPSGLGRQLTRVGVRTPYDLSKRLQRGISQLVFVEERIERAARPMMAQLDVEMS
jgi:hypothetical protein